MRTLAAIGEPWDCCDVCRRDVAGEKVAVLRVDRVPVTICRDCAREVGEVVK